MKLTLKLPGPQGGYNLNPELTDESKLPSGGLSDIQSIVTWATTTLLIAVAILALVFFILGGIGWITSAGDKEKLAAARKKIVYAVIGLIISLGAFMIINIVGELFGVSFFG